MKRFRERVAAALAAGLVTACGPSDGGSPSPDAARPPDVEADGGPDAGASDGGAVDTPPAPDAAPDVAAQDVAGPDASAPDAPAPDATPIDGPPPGDVPMSDVLRADIPPPPDGPPPDSVAPDAPGDDAPPVDAAPADAGAGHVVFVTSTTVMGNFGGIAGGDALCQMLATAAGRAGSWRAILSDSMTDAVTRIAVTGPVRSTTGVLIATGAADLWDGSILAPIDRTESGGTISLTTGNTYTGTRADGRRDARVMGTTFCGDWRGTEGGVQTGSTIRTDARWVELSPDSGGRCDLARRLYCISQ